MLTWVWLAWALCELTKPKLTFVALKKYSRIVLYTNLTSLTREDNRTQPMQSCVIVADYSSRHGISMEFCTLMRGRGCPVMPLSRTEPHSLFGKLYLKEADKILMVPYCNNIKIYMSLCLFISFICPTFSIHNIHILYSISAIVYQIQFLFCSNPLLYATAHQL